MRPKYGEILLLVWSVISTQNVFALDDHIQIKHGWVRLAPPNASVLAGYCTLENHANQSIELVSVQSPLFESVEIHRTEINAGSSRMQRLERLEIKARQSVRFSPNGLHLMLIAPKQKITMDSKIPIRFNFLGQERTVEFIVRRELAQETLP